MTSIVFTLGSTLEAASLKSTLTFVNSSITCSASSTFPWATNQRGDSFKYLRPTKKPIIPIPPRRKIDRQALGLSGITTLHKIPIKGAAMKPIDAVRLCHFPLVALGVISAIYTCEQTIKQKIPNPVMARVIVNIKRLGAKPLATDAREKINMEARMFFSDQLSPK